MYKGDMRSHQWIFICSFDTLTIPLCRGLVHKYQNVLYTLNGKTDVL